VVPTRVVASGVIQNVLRLSGMTASPDSSLLLAPRMPGRGVRGGSNFSLVLNDLAPAGARVKAGDVVAAFDNIYVLNRLDDYRAQVVQHEGMIKKLRSDLDVKRAQHNQLIRVAKANFDKAVLDLRTAPVRSAIQIENFKLNRDEADAHLAELLKQSKLMEVSEQAAIRKYELDLADAQLELKRAQANADRMILRAPRNGLVVLAPVRRGAEMGQVQVGDQIGSGQAILQIVDTDTLVVDATVNQSDAEMIHAGMPARVHLDAYPGVELPAKVQTVGFYARPQGFRPDWVRSMTVRLEVKATDPRVIPDLSASADLVLQTSEEAPIVPLDYLTRDGDQPAVFVRNGQSWQKRPVELGARNYIQAAAISGVKPGDVIGRPADVAAILR
jgi:multidrug efflux pump subunit AcrA (membrane-fusion protein)